MDINVWLMMILSLQHIFCVDGANSYAYKATELILVNCGSPTSFQIDDRTWSADISSEQFSLIEQHQNNSLLSSVKATTSQPNVPSSGDPFPSTTARLSLSEFTYSFVVTDGPKFVRLRFYPASYSNFDRTSSLFSVKSGTFTLLKDFNASLTADNDDDSSITVSREYCIYVQPGDQRLNITFIPNSTTHTNAYAFINAIEVVSMPTYLYYSNPDISGFSYVGHEYLYTIQNNGALEKLYRINVGGSQISPDSDTGMFRFWEDDMPYLEQEYAHSLPNYFDPSGLKYTRIQNYTAPDRVYVTARSYGMNESSITYNVTWEFEVDSAFTYMVRLHFCEDDPTIQSTGKRVFQIFIADYLVEGHADVFEWAGDNLTPYYRDYAVSTWSKEQNLKKLNLSIKLQPHPNPKLSAYNDVILNGIEVFKLSDDAGNLGGPNPDRRASTSLQPSELQKNVSKNSKKTIISIVVGVASGFVLLSLVLLIFWRMNTRVQKSRAKYKTSYGTHGSPLLPSHLCRCFSIAEIKAATNNFDEIFIVGIGGFGNVYKGYIDDGTIPVAIKRLKPGSQQGAREFQTEIEMLSQLRHKHLVSLIGYCNDGDEMILVYEFMARGTLRDHLYGSDCKKPLCWKQRLEMCLGAARGLHYLHTGANRNIIHRDVKSTNILVDEKWEAKVSDFGLSKVGPTGMSRSHISTVVKGSIGYLDPEYYKRQMLTQKSDVYSFGVVLLEALCGRPPLDRTVEKQKASLVQWVRRCHHDGAIHQVVDPFLIESITPECLKAFSDMALSCVDDDGNQRPSMNEVVWGLEFSLEQQRSTEDTVMDESGTQKKEEEKLLRKGVEDEESEMRFTSSSEGMTSESKSSGITMCSSEEEALNSVTVFPELGKPTGDELKALPISFSK